jgi:hypothetical protein
MDLPLFLYPYYRSFEYSFSSMLILQMANTRNRVITNNDEDNGEDNNNDVNPPPPPPSTLEQVLAMQEQML